MFFFDESYNLYIYFATLLKILILGVSYKMIIQIEDFILKKRFDLFLIIRMCRIYRLNLNWLVSVNLLKAQNCNCVQNF